MKRNTKGNTFVKAHLPLPLSFSHSLRGRAGRNRNRPAGRPNILFFFADDWGRYAGCYAGLDGRPTISDVVKTPTIDRIAQAGRRVSQCVRDRAKLHAVPQLAVVGAVFLPHRPRRDFAGRRLGPGDSVYPLMLRDAGYHIGKSYKVWSPGVPIDAPYGGQQYAYEKAGRDMCRFSERATAMVRGGMPVEAAKQKILGQVRDNFDAFLADRKPGQPFCYWFGPTHTHRPYEKGSGKALWGIEPDSRERQAAGVHARRSRSPRRLHRLHGRNPGVGRRHRRDSQGGRKDRRAGQYARRHQRRPRHARRARRQMQPLRPRCGRGPDCRAGRAFPAAASRTISST